MCGGCAVPTRFGISHALIPQLCVATLGIRPYYELALKVLPYGLEKRNGVPKLSIPHSLSATA